MPKVFSDWNVLEHGPLEKLADNLWRVSGALPGMSLRRTMVIAQRRDGSLVVHNGIALREETLAELTSKGPIADLLVPSAYHRLDAPAWAKRFPDVRIYAPRGARKAIEKVVRVEGTFEDFPNDDIVWLEALRGIGDAEGAMLVRSSDGITVVLADVMFNMDRKRDFMGRLITTVLGSAPGPRLSRIVKLALIKDQPALRAEFLRFAEMPDLTRLIVAHEKVAHGKDAASALRQASTYLRA
jgi:hypothetical protein